MHSGQKKLQKDSESRVSFPPGYYAVLTWYCKVYAVCRATKHPHCQPAENSVYKVILQSLMRSISMDFFAMPEVTVEGEVFDCVILAVDRHSGNIVAISGRKSKKKAKRDKHGVGLQANTVVHANLRHLLTVFNFPVVICSDRGTQFVGAWLRTMCKYMGVRCAKTMAYHRGSNKRAEMHVGSDVRACDLWADPSDAC